MNGMNFQIGKQRSCLLVLVAFFSLKTSNNQHLPDKTGQAVAKEVA